jgi:Methyltransferase domain
MAAHDATQSASSTQPKGSVTSTDTSPFDAYDQKVAAADVSRYRKNGPRPWTRTLIEAIKAEGVKGATLLDIGGGIGVIQHELLDSGAAHATSVEASSAYLAEARRETDQRGLVDRVTYHHGDFVDLADSIQPADVVTLIESSTSTRTGAPCVPLGRTRAAPQRRGDPAGHALRQSGHLCDQPGPATAPTAGSRCDRFDRRARADPPPGRSQSVVRRDGRACLAGRALPPRLTSDARLGTSCQGAISRRSSAPTETSTPVDARSTIGVG